MQVCLVVINQGLILTYDKIHLAFKDFFFLNVKNEVYLSDVRVKHGLLFDGKGIMH